MILGLLFACATDPGLAADPRTPERCRAYAADPDTFAACVSGSAADLATSTQARDVCSLLSGSAAISCRSGWVTRHATSAPMAQRAELEAMCLGSDDCGLVLAEAWALPDPVDQFALCGRLTGRFISDCNGHALDRWARARPDAAERERLAAYSAQVPQVSFWIGVVLRCQGAPEITPGSDETTAAAALGCPPRASAKGCVQGFVDAKSRPELCAAHAGPIFGTPQSFSPTPGPPSSSTPGAVPPPPR